MKHFKTDYNPITGAREDYYWDENTEKLTVRNRYDVTSVLESNKRTANSTIDQRYGKQMLQRVAEIPLGVVVQLKQKHGIDVFSSDPAEKKKLLRILDDPEYRYLKTTAKKLVIPRGAKTA